MKVDRSLENLCLRTAKRQGKWIKRGREGRYILFGRIPESAWTTQCVYRHLDDLAQDLGIEKS